MFVALYVFTDNLAICVKNPNISINKTGEVAR